MKKTAAARKSPSTKPVRTRRTRKAPEEEILTPTPARTRRTRKTAPKEEKALEKPKKTRKTRKPMEKETSMSPTPSRLADMSCFWAAYMAFHDGAVADITAAYNAGADVTPLTEKYLPHLELGVKHGKKIYPWYMLCIEKYIDPLIENRVVGGLGQARKSIIRKKGKRGVKKKKSETWVAIGVFTGKAFSRIYKAAGAPERVWTGRGLTATKALNQAFKQKEMPSLLHSLAAIPSISSLKYLQAWTSQAADLLGAGLSNFEKTITSVQNAVGAAEEIRKVDRKLKTSDPMDPKTVELQDQKKELADQIEKIAKDSPSPQAVLAAAVVAVEPPAGGVLDRMDYSDDQKDALTVTGRAIIAAGAGSGKTRVLAGKVVWHMEEQGLKPSEIMACSFSKKSSLELIKRVEDYGGNIGSKQSKMARSGFGTTHSIAKRMLMRHNFAKYSGEVLASFKQADMIRLAILQVLMSGTEEEGWSVPPRDDTFFESVDKDKDPAEERIALLERAFEVVKRVVDGAESSYGRSGWMDDVRNIIWKWEGSKPDPETLSQAQKDMVNRVLGYAVRRGQTERSYTRRSLQMKGLGHVRVASSTTLKTPIRHRVAGEEEKEPAWKDKIVKWNPMWGTTPANQWFNLGVPWSKFNEGTEKEPKYIPIGTFALHISKQKGKLIAPGKDAYEAQQKRREEQSEALGISIDDMEPLRELTPQDTSIFSAVYGAYEWLKNRDSRYSGDFDDMLLNVSQEMIANRAFRAQIKSQFKMILVDEAQDLNAAQHLFVGLVAGYYDPETQKPRESGEMSAETLVLIGDDKQSIYAFRGAEPDVFVGKSEMDPDSTEKYSTKLLTMNYRSGAAIVDAANQLISYNTKQIKMVCQANVEKNGQGSIQEVTVHDIDELAPTVAKEIASMTQGDGATSKYKDYGIAVRTNKEAYAYGLEMIKKGIPFRSKYNFFKGPAKKVLSLVQLATMGEKARTASPKKINGFVKDALKLLNWDISAITLEKAIDAQIEEGQNYLDFLLDGGWRKIYGNRRRNEEVVKPFVDYLEEFMHLNKDRKEPLEAEGIIQYAQDRQGGVDGKSLREKLVSSVKDNGKSMEDLAKSALTGDDVSLEEAIEEYALAPLALLKSASTSYPTAKGFVAYMNKLERANAKLSKTDNPDDKGFKLDVDAVQLDTVHGWKGLEAPHMYIPMWESPPGGKGGFPHPRSDSPEDIEAERRLAYVAITRGEESVTILRPQVVGAGLKGPILSKQSRFVKEACIRTAGKSIKSRKPRKSSSWVTDAEVEEFFRRDASYTDDDFELPNEALDLEDKWWNLQ